MDIALTQTKLTWAFARNLAFFTVAVLSSLTTVSGQQERDKTSVILIPPFENQTNQHENIKYEANSGESTRRFSVDRLTVDRYTEAPRTLLENLVSNVKGVSIVERKRIDTLLLENEFGKSGLVDADKALKMGKLIGANIIVVGTLTDLRDEIVKFQGYGIKNENTTVNCTIRIRILAGETGTQLFSEIYKGTKSYTKSSYGETKSSDRNFAAVEATIEKIAQDESFRNVLVGKPSEKTSIDGFVEVDFSPKPDNCDVEIDGKYIGGSPLKKRLLAGKEYKIRFSKNGFKDWTGTISPEVGQRITKELEASR